MASSPLLVRELVGRIQAADGVRDNVDVQRGDKGTGRVWLGAIAAVAPHTCNGVATVPIKMETSVFVLATWPQL